MHPTMNRLYSRLLAFFWMALAVFGQGSAFVNFETAPLHPVAMSVDGQRLAVCNLPDGRVELFDLSGGLPRSSGSVFTGLDPVSARFNHRGELWVVNHISDSITIIDPSSLKAMATLETFDAPVDVVFTKNPARAYVSHSTPNIVEVWDLETRSSLGSIEIDGDRPKAMSVSADESEIYIAIFESGNASTIIAPQLTTLTRTPQHTVVDMAEGPHGGQNPFPNAGDVFAPIINPAIPATNPPPKVSLIVKKRNGRWMDDSFGDWTEFISGTNSFLTGRPPGWDIADHDLAILKTSDRSLRYVRGLMNICADVAVNPASGKVAVIGTDALNEVRFEPVLKSIFTRMRLALVDPGNSTTEALDLNAHLDYSRQTLPKAERRQTVGDPRGVAWNSRGTRMYVTGMGSNNLLMLDENGQRISVAQLPEGPTGLVCDERRNLVHVYCRFESRLVSVDGETLAIVSSVPIHDSTPAAIRVGRRHFYNTIENSGLGLGSCAACHVDGRFDRLAWDLGDMTGEMIKITTNRNFTFLPAVTNHFHPMKGPMITQTLQDIIKHEPFHWRGDRDGIEQFSPTFVGLQGADEEPTPEEMREFKTFLESVAFPPNPFRNLDNTLPTTLGLPGERSFGRGQLRAGAELPPGNAVRGMSFFRAATAPGCILCHTLPTGLGTSARFVGGRWQTIPHGTNEERHVAMVGFERSEMLPFKVQHLRNLFDKNGFDLRSPVSRSGFGFFHDGRVDSLTRLLQDGFAVNDDQQTADAIAFLLAFTGSDLPEPAIGDPNRGPGLPGKDVQAGVGLQTVQTNSASSSRLLFMMSAARTVPPNRVELIVRGIKEGKTRGWLMRGPIFVSDRNETNTTAAILELASAATPLTFTFVPLGSGQRLALDRDGDGFFNQIEIEAGSDPANPDITPETTTPRIASFGISGGMARLEFFGRASSRYRVQSRPAFATESPWEDRSESIAPRNWSEPHDTTGQPRFYRIVLAP